MTNKIKILMIGALLLLLTSCKQSNLNDEAWYNEYHVIAHAMGGLEGKYDYTNTNEAFLENYNKGTRLFEVDITKSKDGELILLHEWEQYYEDFATNLKCCEALNAKEFKDNKILGKYTPLLFSEVLQLMQIYPDIYIIVDSKTFELKEATTYYSDFVNEVERFDKTLLERIIPQAYTPEMYTMLADTDKFKDIIFTLYHYYVDSDGQKIYDFLAKNGVKVVVMHMNDEWAYRVITDIREYAKYDHNYQNLRIYIHTINDMDKTKQIVNDEEFFGVYSDFITEDMFKLEFGD